MPAHAAVGVQGVLDEAGLPADARHQPVRLLIRPLPGGPPHLRRRTPTALSMLWDAAPPPWQPAYPKWHLKLAFPIGTIGTSGWHH